MHTKSTSIYFEDSYMDAIVWAIGDLWAIPNHKVDDKHRDKFRLLTNRLADLYRQVM